MLSELRATETDRRDRTLYHAAFAGVGNGTLSQVTTVDKTPDAVHATHNDQRSTSPTLVISTE